MGYLYYLFSVNKSRIRTNELKVSTVDLLKKKKGIKGLHIRTSNNEKIINKNFSPLP